MTSFFFVTSSALKCRLIGGLLLLLLLSLFRRVSLFGDRPDGAIISSKMHAQGVGLHNVGHVGQSASGKSKPIISAAIVVDSLEMLLLYRQITYQLV